MAPCATQLAYDVVKHWDLEPSFYIVQVDLNLLKFILAHCHSFQAAATGNESVRYQPADWLVDRDSMVKSGR